MNAKKFSEEIAAMDLSDLLEFKSILEKAIAVQALKSLDPVTLEEMDGDKRFSGTTSLAKKVDML